MATDEQKKLVQVEQQMLWTVTKVSPTASSHHLKMEMNKGVAPVALDHVACALVTGKRSKKYFPVTSVCSLPTNLEP